MSVARFIADQRTKYRVPHTVTCLLLGVSVAWFYKWIRRAESPDGVYTDTGRRRAALDVAVVEAFGAARGLHGSPRLLDDLRDLGWQVSEKSVAHSMRRQGLVARKIRRRRGLTKQDRTAPKFPDLIKRDFTATEPNRKWVGDMTEIPIESGPKLYLATVIDLFSRRLLGAGHGPAPGGRVGVRGPQDGRRCPWRPPSDLAGRPVQTGYIPHRPRQHLYRQGIHDAVPAVGNSAVHGPCRLVLRQRRSGGFLLLTGVGSVVPQQVQ